LDAPEDVLVSRIEGRRGDPSDADAAVVRAQLSQHPGPIGWHRLDASQPAGLVLQAATVSLRQHVSDSVNTAAGDAR
jgi:predicted kinase